MIGKIFIIYSTENPSLYTIHCTGQKYIGSHFSNIKQTYRDWLKTNKVAEYSNTALLFNKYPLETFKYKLLESFECDTL